MPMGISAESGRAEGWLYIIGSNRFGLQHPKKRYFVLEDNVLNCFKSVPTSSKEGPRRSALIDSCIRVADNGRENIHKNLFFIFTVYNASNNPYQLKLGARSSEEAAGWIHSLMNAAVKAETPRREEHLMLFSQQKRNSFRLSRKRRPSNTQSGDWTSFAPNSSGQLSTDVVAPSVWAIIGCKNGLRLFKEEKGSDLMVENCDDNPAVMAVCVVDAAPEAIFDTIMSLGSSRTQWDFCFAHGKVIEHLDGHTDIIHEKLRGDWLPRGMRRRDLLLRRYWRREDDGTYVILYHSIFHEQCRIESGYIRAFLKSGGYVISPVNQGKQSVVKHMLAIDWKTWKSYIFISSSRHITERMLGRVAALRELFRAKLANYSVTGFPSEDITRDFGTTHIEKEEVIKEEVHIGDENILTVNGNEMRRLDDSRIRVVSSDGPFLQLHDVADEFFDVPEQNGGDDSELELSSDPCLFSLDRHPEVASVAGLAKRLQDISVQKKGDINIQEVQTVDRVPCCFGTTLSKDPSCELTCSWTTAETSTFLIRGETYFQDQNKIKANHTLMQMVAADWLRSDKREDDLGGRPSSIVQKYAAQGGDEFFFVVNIQVPGTTTYNLVLYYMLDTPLENIPLLASFVNGDDAFRNSRFKLIPYISKGSWIVKQSVGKKACLIGQALEMHYFRGRNYLEIDIDVGSSTVARGVMSLVLSYLNNLVIEMAFLIQANNQEELPEVLLGTCRLNHLDALKSVAISPS